MNFLNGKIHILILCSKDLLLNIGMEYVKIIKAETLKRMMNSYYLDNILWSTHLPKHKHKARTIPTIIPLTLTHHLSTKSSPKPHLKKNIKAKHDTLNPNIKSQKTTYKHMRPEPCPFFISFFSTASRLNMEN